MDILDWLSARGQNFMVFGLGTLIGLFLITLVFKTVFDRWRWQK